MKMKELQTMGSSELKRQLTTLREQARDLSFKIHSKEIKNNHLLSAIKKDIARILTIINQQSDAK